MSDETGKKIIERSDRMFNTVERSNQKNNWELLSEFLTPNQYNNYNTKRSKGLKNTQRLYDSTGPKAVKDLASVLNETLTNEQLKFIKFKFEDEKFNKDRNAVDWLDKANNTFNDAVTDSNFNSAINSFYSQYVALGSSCILVEEKPNTPMRFGKLIFKAISMTDIVWTQNPEGIVDTIYRRIKMTNENALRKYGEFSEDIVKQAEADPDKERELIVHVSPRKDKDINIDRAGLAPGSERPFLSCVVDRESNTVIEEDGYFEFPYLCVRWDLMPDEVYGRGRGHLALPEVRSLNRIRELYLEALALVIFPPMKAVKRQLTSDPNWAPKAINYVPDMNSLEPMRLGIDLNSAQFGMKEAEDKINGIFFIDKLFFAPRDQQGEQTTAEVNERISQMGKVLGSTVGRLISELLQPMTKRVYGILLRGSALPELPSNLEDEAAKLTVEYVNPLTRSRRIEEVQATQRLAQDAALLAQIGLTDALDILDVDAIMKANAEIYGVPVGVLRDQKEVDAARQQRAQQQQQQQQIEQGVQLADIQSKQAASNRTGGAQ